MAIKKETIQKIAALLKIEKAKVDEALASDQEMDLEIPQGLTVFSGADLESRDNGIKKQGIEAGKEIAIKDLKSAAGLEYDGKDPAKFLEQITAKVKTDSNITVDQQIKDKDKVIDGLRKNLGERDSKISELTTAAESARMDSELLGMFPANRSNILSDPEYLSLIRNNYEIIQHDGVRAVRNKQTGEPVLTTDTLKPISPADVIKSHFETKKWVAEADNGGGSTPKGRGAGDGRHNNTGGITNMAQFQAHLKEQNIHPSSERASAMLNDIASKNPNFDMGLTPTK